MRPSKTPTMPPVPAPEWLTVCEAAGYARVSRATLDRWLQRGLRGYRPGGGTRVLIRRSELDDFLAAATAA